MVKVIALDLGNERFHMFDNMEIKIIIYVNEESIEFYFLSNLHLRIKHSCDLYLKYIYILREYFINFFFYKYFYKFLLSFFFKIRIRFLHLFQFKDKTSFIFSYFLSFLIKIFSNEILIFLHIDSFERYQKISRIWQIANCKF